MALKLKYIQKSTALLQIFTLRRRCRKKGQVIAKLDTKELLRAKQRAEADLQMSRSQLAQAETNLALQAKDSVISEQQARTNLANAEANLNRLKAGAKPQEIAC